MPLAFESKNRGTVVFGFFNVESDMLLLERCFLFATEFCDHIGRLAESTAEDRYETVWPVYFIEDSERIGDLMGAIHGMHFTGFIGETYKRFPFPYDPAGFRQKTRGNETQAAFRELIEPYADRIEIPFIADPTTDEITIGDFRFTRRWFHELIRYVQNGGYPKWQNNEPPDYVLAMKRRIEAVLAPEAFGPSRWLFEGGKF